MWLRLTQLKMILFPTHYALSLGSLALFLCKLHNYTGCKKKGLRPIPRDMFYYGVYYSGHKTNSLIVSYVANWP